MLRATRHILFLAAIGFVFLLPKVALALPSLNPLDDSQTQNELREDLSRKPLLEIRIPGLSFSNLASSSEGGDTYLYISWIPELISAVYKFSIAIVSIVAVIIIIIQGVVVITSGGSGEQHSGAYKKITHAVIGLFIAWGSFIILYTINPKLTEFNPLKVKVVARQDILEEGLAGEEEETVGTVPLVVTDDNALDHFNKCGAGQAKFVTVGPETKGVNLSAQINIETVDSYKTVAALLYTKSASLPGGPYSIRGTGRRPLGQKGDFAKCNGKPKTGECAEGSWSQAFKWEGKCLGNTKCEGAPICNPYGWNYVSLDSNGKIILDDDACPIADNCPHTTGSAVDITCTSPTLVSWYKRQYDGAVPRAEGPFYAPCQRLLEQIMLENGWCRLYSEAWHFEKPLKSGASACSYNLTEIQGTQSGGHDYKTCNGVYDLKSKQCIPVNF